MAFAPPRKAGPSPLHRRSPSCPAVMTTTATARERNPSGSATARSIFTSTPTARGTGATLSSTMKQRQRPSPIVAVNGKGSRSISSRITTTPNRRRRSNSLEINDSRLSEAGGGFQNLSQNRQSTLIEDPPAAGDSNLSTISTVSSVSVPVTGSSLPKVNIAGPSGLTSNSNTNINKPLKFTNPVLQPKLSQNEIITKQNEQKELQLLKLQLHNARFKYLNTAMIHSLVCDTTRNKITGENIHIINNTIDVGLVQTRKENMIDTCKSKYYKDTERSLELNSLQNKLTKVKDIISSPEITTKLNDIKERYSKKFDFIPIKNIEFDKENDTSKIQEFFKEMNLCSTSTKDQDKVPTVFSALSQSVQMTEQNELIKKEKELLNIYREKLIEKESLKASLNIVKK